MQDNYGRNINYLRLSITDSCNYRCIYCVDSETSLNNRDNSLLSIEELINIGKQAVNCGINKIRITGGEPLIRDGVLKLCDELKSIDGLDELAITTNGSLLAKMAKDLKIAGVDRLNISLDSLNEDKFRKISRIGSLDKVLEGINEALRVGFKNIKINVVLMSGINDDEIINFVNMTKDNPINVRFIELMPIGPCKNMYSKYFISTNEVIKKVPRLNKVGNDGVSSLYKLDQAVGTVGLISPISECFCGNCNRLRVTSDGRLLPCLHSDLEYNIRGLSNDEIIKAFCLAIENKPVSHHIVENHMSDNSDYMNKIGG